VPAKLIFQLVGEAQSAIAAFKQTGDAAKTATGAATNTGSALLKIGTAVATGYAVKKIIDFGKSTVDAAGAAAHANKLVTATFKDAGDATGQAAKHAIDLAEALGRQIGVSPNVIKGAEGILATFHSVSGEVGMQAGIFDRATKAAADLAAAGFGDMETNAKQLGKALEDPTKGMTALTRSGVNFTQAQKDQIKNMQKSGDLLGAQKLILGEVEKQVGGTAAATAGAGAKMSVAWEEMKVKLGTGLLPIVGQVKTLFAGLFDFIGANASWLTPLLLAAATFATALFVTAKAVQMFQVTIEGIKLAIAGFRIVWLALNSSFLASPIGLIIIAIVALIAVIVLIATKTTWFQTIWATVTRFMATAWNATVGAITGAWSAAFGFISGIFRGILSVAQTVWNWIKGNWPWIAGVLMGPFGIAAAAVYTYWTPISGFFSSLVGRIAGAISGVVGAITQPFITAFNIVRSVVESAVSYITGLVHNLTAVVSSGVNMAKGIYNAFAHVWNAISVSIPEVDTHIPGIGKIGGGSISLPKLPILAAGGLMTRSGLVYAHAGEVISPAPASAVRPSMEQLVRIDNANFGERVDVDVFAKRLAWQLRTAGV
jgi:phage-related protein